jgi:hypothetical protein
LCIRLFHIKKGSHSIAKAVVDVRAQVNTKPKEIKGIQFRYELGNSTFFPYD